MVDFFVFSNNVTLNLVSNVIMRLPRHFTTLRRTYRHLEYILHEELSHMNPERRQELAGILSIRSRAHESGIILSDMEDTTEHKKRTKGY